MCASSVSPPSLVTDGRFAVELSDGVRGYTAFHRTTIAFLSGLCTDCHPTNWLTPPLSLSFSLSLSFTCPYSKLQRWSLDLSPPSPRLATLLAISAPTGAPSSEFRLDRVLAGLPEVKDRVVTQRLNRSRLARGVHSIGQPAAFKLSASVCCVTCASRGLPHVCWAHGCRQTGAERSCWALGGLGGETCAICMAVAGPPSQPGGGGGRNPRTKSHAFQPRKAIRQSRVCGLN